MQNKLLTLPALVILIGTLGYLSHTQITLNALLTLGKCSSKDQIVSFVRSLEVGIMRDNHSSDVIMQDINHFVSIPFI